MISYHFAKWRGYQRLLQFSCYIYPFLWKWKNLILLIQYETTILELDNKPLKIIENLSPFLSIRFYTYAFWSWILYSHNLMRAYCIVHCFNTHIPDRNLAAYTSERIALWNNTLCVSKQLCASALSSILIKQYVGDMMEYSSDKITIQCNSTLATAL